MWCSQKKPLPSLVSQHLIILSSRSAQHLHPSLHREKHHHHHRHLDAVSALPISVLLDHFLTSVLSRLCTAIWTSSLLSAADNAHTIHRWGYLLCMMMMLVSCCCWWSSLTTTSPVASLSFPFFLHRVFIFVCSSMFCVYVHLFVCPLHKNLSWININLIRY